MQTTSYRLVRAFGTDTHPWTLVRYVWTARDVTLFSVCRYSNRDFKKGCEDAQRLRDGDEL